MKSICFPAACACVLVFVLLTSPANADVSLPSIFGNNMVLQQQQPIKVWGWTDPQDSVKVKIGKNSAETTADENGRWSVELPAIEASLEPLDFVVTGSHNEIRYENVVVGEVWLCSGQSNMAWTVDRSANAEKEKAAANFPLIRHIEVPRHPSMAPAENFEGTWNVCSPETVGGFTACGYFMARKLHQEINVPIGLVNSSWGGTRVEPWTPPNGFAKVPSLSVIHETLTTKTPGSAPFREGLAKYLREHAAWTTQAQQSLETASALALPPAYPTAISPYTRHQDPAMLYQGMIHPLVGFPIRGAIWYQGEANHQEGMLYADKKKALIEGWRELWKNEFPFYFVQLAPFQYGNEDPTLLAKFWEAQAAVLEIPKTGMVITNDITTVGNIHPPNKQDVGLRLANLALKNDYGKSDVVANSPRFRDMESLDDGRLKLNFDFAGGGLKTRDGSPPTWFEVVGSGSGGFQQANAQIKGDAIILGCEKVTQPTGFRFAWNKKAEPNLCGGTGLPVGAFRGGKVPSFLDSVPGSDKLKLVYELDLAKLGKKIKYDVDNSASIGEFDKVAWHVQLKSQQHGTQNVFVTADAFTKDVHHIAVPSLASGAFYKQAVTGVNVQSDVIGIQNGPVPNACMEFWPNNYGPQNPDRIANASRQKYDFGDAPADPKDGYGSMQVHDVGRKTTLFAINHFKAGPGADIGIGNSNTEHPDWTFSKSSPRYSTKVLRVYVRTK